MIKKKGTEDMAENVKGQIFLHIKIRLTTDFSKACVQLKVSLTQPPDNGGSQMWWFS